jgi:uncharacterized membrane protein (DUF485 family)
MNKHKILEMTKDPKYIQLVQSRSRFSWILTIIMLTVYFGFISLVAFNKEFLARPIGAGVTTLSIPIGIGVILFTIFITNLYVRRANSEFDELTHEIKEGNK